jgi:hypothetical protein
MKMKELLLKYCVSFVVCAVLYWPMQRWFGSPARNGLEYFLAPLGVVVVWLLCDRLRQAIVGSEPD